MYFILSHIKVMFKWTLNVPLYVLFPSPKTVINSHIIRRKTHIQSNTISYNKTMSKRHTQIRTLALKLGYLYILIQVKCSYCLRL